MAAKPRLMTQLDRCAEELLNRYFPENPAAAAVPDSKESIDAFKAVSAYFGPRTKLGGADDESGSEFERLRSGLHRKRRKTSRAGGYGYAQTGNGIDGGGGEPDPSATAGDSPDDGDTTGIDN